MASIDNVLVSDVEKAFGLNAGDLKLVDSPECAPLLKQNAWTKMENTLAHVTSFDPIRKTAFTYFAKTVVATSSPVFEVPEGGLVYREHVTYGPTRLYNLQVTYHVMGYVNEECRIVKAVFPWERIDKSVETMTDLSMTTICSDKIKNGEFIAWYLEGPKSDEFWEQSFGRVIAGFKLIDLERDIGCMTPQKIKQKARELSMKMK